MIDLNNKRVGKGQEKRGLWATSLVLLAVLALSTCALAQEKTSESWIKEGLILSENGSYEQALLAYDR